MATPVFESIFSGLKDKEPAEQAAAVKERVSALPADQQAVVAQDLGIRLPEPDQTTSNKVWLIIIQAFAFAMIAAVTVLGIGVFVAPAIHGTKPDTILTIFTTVTAFLAGLFAPSPVAKKTGS